MGLIEVIPRAIVAALLLAPGMATARSRCLTDAEIDRAIGNQVRSGAVVLDTSTIPDLPLCSSLPLAMQIQRIREAAFPQEIGRARIAQEKLAERERLAVLARVPAAPAPIAPIIEAPVPEPVPPVMLAEPVPDSAPPVARQAKVRKKVKPAPARRTPAASAYFANCRAARAAGAAPIFRGDPGYSRRLDRDGDGVACE